MTIYSTYNRIIKASAAERVIQTIEVRIYKYLHRCKSSRYIDKLPDLVYGYNIAPHLSLLGRCPYDVYLMSDASEIQTLQREMYKKKRRLIKVPRCKLDVGAYVRLQCSDASLKTFRKVNEPSFTSEVFRITAVNKPHYPYTYEVSDLDTATPLKGYFYKQELSQCKRPESFAIRILKKRTKGNQKELYVVYSDYPDSLSIWIKETELVT